MPRELELGLGGRLCVFVRDLELDVLIGILAHERRAPQRVRLNVAAFVADPGPHDSTDIADYVSYADIVDGIKTLAASGRHIPLVENLAEEVARLVLADDRVERVIVEVQKPDIIPEAGSVGVAIERRRPDPDAGAER